MMELNYFVCSLGQASLRDDGQKEQTVVGLIERQARRVPQAPAIGFYHPNRDDQNWRSTTLSFGDLSRGMELVAELLQEETTQILPPHQMVALLCPTSVDFLFVWLALIRLGHPVLLIAPQCQPQAIAHLCRVCEASLLLYHDAYEDLAQEAADIKDKSDVKSLQIRPISFGEHVTVYDVIQRTPRGSLEKPDIADPSTAYLHHTSGTSSGLPKPIPQPHRAAVGVLPYIPSGAQKATFTTTPLYHGGIADLFRAWTSDALIWLFPEKEVPVTAGNIVRCLEIAEGHSKRVKTPPVRYFSSVPYILQMMATNKHGIDYLKNMDIVGVGGAALPDEVGNELVNQGVNLVSRFGSAECGFLMSSHREYDKDKEWQYLRPGSGAHFLKFEPQGDGTSELVIQPGWPHMAKRNRPNGAFATADLFVPHHTIPNAWKYHSRADSQLTLITGKKFDPAPVESAMATSPLLDDVLIFGNGRPYPGALLFRSETSAKTSDEELIAALASMVEKLNSESQSHARLPRNMLVPMKHSKTNLEKSSKGTILRTKAEERYAQDIERAYSKVTLGGDEVPDEDISAAILRTVGAVVGISKDLSITTDLFSYGVDSVACVQIRCTLLHLLPAGNRDLPLTVVEDCGTIERLSDYIIRSRHGQEIEAYEDDNQLILDLVEEHSRFTDHHDQAGGQSFSSAQPSPETVVLTGATGALGAHLLSVYRASPDISKIYCLVRGADHNAAWERVDKALRQRALDPLSRNDEEKVIVLPAKLTNHKLGLSNDDYNRLAHESTIIMHVAWTVNFRLGLRSFVKDHIAGLRNLINLSLTSARATPPKFAFCSSTASVINTTIMPIPDSVIDDPASSSNLGYSRSKWVAEQICGNAHKNTRLRSRISILRVGQLSGDTVHGHWNTSEAWPLMLSSVKVTGCLPKLDGEALSWLPVDVAAEAMVEATSSSIANVSSDNSMCVYHILNDNRGTEWNDLLRWLKEDGQRFDIVEPREWVQRLEEASSTGGQRRNTSPTHATHNDVQEREKEEETETSKPPPYPSQRASSAEKNKKEEHPAMKLLHHWKKAYCQDDQQSTTSTSTMKRKPPRFKMQRSIRASPVLGNVTALDRDYVIGKLWTWVQQNM